jgi:cytochrome c oxidase cbb3-type subunit III
MSSVMSLVVIVGTLLSLLVFFLLLHANRRANRPGELLDHEFDGIVEYDNPLPGWWYWMYVLSIIFALLYLAYYPGLGNFEGFGKWTQITQLEEGQKKAQEKYGPIFTQYREKTLDELVDTPAAMKMGRRLFVNNCAVCHGATGTGSFGFPNLTDSEWMWGATDEDIVNTITHGRIAGMAAWGEILGDDGVSDVAEYVMQMAGRETDAEIAGRGQSHFNIYCMACHGMDGKGQKIFGAPDLTNEIWLYGNSRGRIEDVIRNGRSGEMPSFKNKLGEDKIHIMSAYVKSLGKVPE